MLRCIYDCVEIPNKMLDCSQCLVQEQEVTSDVSDFEEGDKQRKKHLSSKSSDKPDILPIAPPIPQYHSRYLVAVHTVYKTNVNVYMFIY